MKVYRLSFLFLVLCIACKKAPHVPVELVSAFDYIDETISSTDISKLESKEDKGFPPYYHDLKIQEKLQKELKDNGSHWKHVNRYFDSLGVQNNSDKAGLILNMYQLYLNEIDIQIKDEIKIVDAYRSPILTCDSIQQEQARDYLTRFNVNDVIIVKMPVDEHENAIDYSCPDNDWNYIEGHDLQLKVLLTEKMEKSNLKHCYFEVKIIEMSNPFVTILSEELIIGDTLKIPILTAWKLNPEV